MTAPPKEHVSLKFYSVKIPNKVEERHGVRVPLAVGD